MRRPTKATSGERSRKTASPTQPSTAWAQGDAYGRALSLMTAAIADDGGEQQAGDYLIGYAVTDAEGLYEWVDGQLEWREPADANMHLKISVRDADDGRFVPGLRVLATLIDPDGMNIGTHEQPLLWHPMLYHYGRNWVVAVGGEYMLRVHVAPPRFSRQDDVNGLRFMDPVTVDFDCIKVGRGRRALTRPGERTVLP